MTYREFHKVDLNGYTKSSKLDRLIVQEKFSFILLTLNKHNDTQHDDIQHDTKHIDTLHNGTQHDDIRHNDIQHDT